MRLLTAFHSYLCRFWKAVVDGNVKTVILTAAAIGTAVFFFFPQVERFVQIQIGQKAWYYQGEYILAESRPPKVPFCKGQADADRTPTVVSGPPSPGGASSELTTRSTCLHATENIFYHVRWQVTYDEYNSRSCIPSTDKPDEDVEACYKSVKGSLVRLRSGRLDQTGRQEPTISSSVHTVVLPGACLYVLDVQFTKDSQGRPKRNIWFKGVKIDCY